MCGPPREQCEPFCYEEKRKNHDEDDPGLAEERFRHLTHDEDGNRYPDA